MFQLDPVLEQDTILLAHLPLCEMLLMNDSQYPWLILVPRRPMLRELLELSQAESMQMQLESNAVSRMLLHGFHAQKLNVAALGNVVAQLHVHHIARYIGDACWPKPVWGTEPVKPYEQDQLNDTVTRIVEHFVLPGSDFVCWVTGPQSNELFID